MNEHFNVTFTHPGRWLIVGPSFSGKTTFVSKLMEKASEIFNVEFDKKIYCSDTDPGNAFREFELINEIEEMDLNNSNKNLNTIIILDDKMEKAINDNTVSELYTKFSHHYNITIIFLTQNLFPKSKYMRNLYLNSSYIVLMKNPNEIIQINSLSKRIHRGGAKTKLLDAYLDATQDPYSYLVVDLNQETPNKLRFRTDIFNEKNIQTVYI